MVQSGSQSNRTGTAQPQPAAEGGAAPSTPGVGRAGLGSRQPDPSSAVPVVLRYAALQLPGLTACILGAVAAREWLGLPTGIAVAAVLVWIAKDAVLFPFVRAAYEPDPGRPHGDLIATIGIAHDGLDREGYVRLGPELWRARRAPGCPPLVPGERVRVVHIEGLTLTVECVSARSE